MKTAYIESNSFDPWLNLSIEEYLLDNYARDNAVLYLWQNAHTVVIGRNQNAWRECRIENLERDGGKLARRLSGGGAVYHDLGNLNFTFLLPRLEYNLHRQLAVIVDAVKGLGIEANFSGRNDILAEGKKFSGNAFYHGRQASYHHGTVLIDVDMSRLSMYLNVSKAKMESKGVRSVASSGESERSQTRSNDRDNERAMRWLYEVRSYRRFWTTMKSPAGEVKLFTRSIHPGMAAGKSRFDTIENRFVWGGIG